MKQIIVNSKQFRHILKNIGGSFVNSDEEIKFAFKDKILFVECKTYSVEHKENFKASIYYSKIVKMMKVLKHVSEQPILIDFDKDEFTIKTMVI